MNFDLNLLYGVFELHDLNNTLNGERTSERAKSGMLVITRDNRLAVVAGYNEWVMAYSGSYSVKDEVLSILAESCSIREREGSTMTRKILRLDIEWLILESVNAEKGTRAETTWKRKLSL